MSGKISGSSFRNLAKYFFVKLPPALQLGVKTVLRVLDRPQPGESIGSDEPHGLIADIVNNFHVSETFVMRYREQGHGPIDWSRSNWQDFFEALPPLQKLSVPFAMSTVLRGRAMLLLLESQSYIWKKIVTSMLGQAMAASYGQQRKAALER